MTARPTPETDVFCRTNSPSSQHFAGLACLCRKLERSRDEAVELLRELLDSPYDIPTRRKAKTLLMQRTRLDKEKQS